MIQQGELTEYLMQSNVKTNKCDKNEYRQQASFCSKEGSSEINTCVGEEGSGIVCGGVLRGIVSKDCSDDNAFTIYTDVSQNFNWIWLSHLDGTLKMIDNETLRNIVCSILDIVAYFINTPKIADDFEMVKFIF